MIKPSLNIKKWVKILAILAFYQSTALVASDLTNPESEKDKELQKIRSLLIEINKELSTKRQERDSAQSELRKIEIKLAETNRSIRKLNREINAKKNQLAKLNKEKQQLSKNLGTQKDQLAKQIRSAYMMGNQQRLKLLLNQENPASVNRGLVYYNYINDARVNVIKLTEDTLDSLEKVEKTINQEKTILDELKQQHQIKLSLFDEKRYERKKLLASITQSIHQSENTIKDLQANEKRIQTLINSLGNALVDIPFSSLNQNPFNSLKGQLPWPTKGRLKHRFGQKRGSGDMQWHGVSIAAPSGRDVKAISHGRIIFADWLQNFGLIIIIDHQDGYMSLYGHNQALYKEIGDWVSPNEIIASVGDSGGQTESALYFEIRHLGKPIDPTHWCSG